MLIDQEKYFVLHAPRQVGKTSYMLALSDYLNEQGTYRALYFNVEPAQAVRENIESAMQVILGSLASAARDFLHDPFPNQVMGQILAERGAGALEEMLTRWAEQSEKPIVLFIDEIDTLIGDTLISVLRQLRAGYYKRPTHFPHSIVLCGIRDVRDYRIHSSREKTVITGGSAFNIKAESLRMGDFIQAEVEMLFEQHTQETGQIFQPATVNYIWELTQGQPWLVNALGYEVCFRMKANRDRSVPITMDMVAEAKENLILRRETHIDQLADKLKEEQVRRIISPMLEGTQLDNSVSDDDIQYLVDLGLIRRVGKKAEVSNPIYREVIPRHLTEVTQTNLAAYFEPIWYVAEDGSLDMEKLLTDFQAFFRENSEHWGERFKYKEAGPQLLMQGHLQRIVNGGGQIQREYGLGRGRTDLLIIWPYGEGHVQKSVIELKIRYGKLDKTIEEGLKQTWYYMDRAGTENGHLVIFDRSLNKPWAEKIFTETRTQDGKTIKVWGM